MGVRVFAKLKASAMKKNKKAKRPKYFPFLSETLYYTLGVSFFFHVLLMFLSPHTFFISGKKQEKKSRTRIILTSLPKKAKQIVETKKSESSNPFQNTRFYGQKNQRVDHETVSKNVGPFNEGGLGVERAIPKNLHMSDFRVNPRGENQISKRVMVSKRLSSRQGMVRGRLDREGLAQSNDFMEDIPLGEMTLLNTVEYKYYGFYHRIKKKLEQYWGHTLREKVQALWKRGRTLAGAQNRITSLVILLDHKGGIVKIILKGTSGVRELDEAAIESFNKAGPFPNPPKGMIKKGLAKIEWGFVVKS